MKKSLIILLACGLATLSACKKDKLTTVSATVAPPQITSPADGTTIVVTPADSTQNLNIIWKKADYGVQTLITSDVQVAVAGSGFVKKAVLGNTVTDTLKITYGALNNIVLNKLNLSANAASSVEIRVASSINGADTVFSKSIKLNVTTYKLVVPAKLYLPGSYQGNSVVTAPSIPRQAGYMYEGYAYFNAAGNFKFVTATDNTQVSYGYGNKADSLTSSTNASGISYATAGYYKLNADINKLTFHAALIQSFGLIGTATVGQWDHSTPMIFNPTTGLWSITTVLSAGALKFRANDGWDINYGPANSNATTGSLIQTNDAININVAGNYTVTMDMSQSTHSTYYYTVVKN